MGEEEEEPKVEGIDHCERGERIKHHVLFCWMFHETQEIVPGGEHEHPDKRVHLGILGIIDGEREECKEEGGNEGCCFILCYFLRKEEEVENTECGEDD